MADLGTVSILVDVRGQPIVRELAKDLNNVATSEKQVSDRTKQVIADMQRLRTIMRNVEQSVDGATTSFKRFSAQELQQTSQRMQGFERAVNNTRRGMGGMGMAIQQTGYQVGDFLVQVQSGTNWMVAFGQQATQLVGILPMMGAGFMGLSMGSLVALSAALGIAIPLVTAIGAYFMRTREQAKAGSAGINTYADAIEALTSEIQRNQEAFLKLKFDTESSGVAKSRQEIENLRKEIPKVKAEIEAFYAALYQTAGTQGTGGGILAAGMVLKDAFLGTEADALQERLAALEAMLSTLEAQEEAQRMLNGGLSVAAGIQKGLVYDKTVELRVARELEAAQKAVNAALSSGDAENFNQAIEDALDAGVKFSQLDLSTIVATAARNGWSLAASIKAAFAAANGGPVVNANAGMGPGFEGGGRSGSTMAPYIPPAATLDDLIARDTPKVSGGGVGGRARQIKEETRLTKELTQAEKDRQTVLKSIESSLESGFMSMVDGTKSVKDAFKSMAAEIIKELYRVLVVQRMVGSFDVATGGGSGIMGFLGGLFKRETGGTMMPGQPYLVGERGPELVIPRHSGTVVNANQTANAIGGSGSVTVNNNISVTGSDAAMVRTEIAKMIPQITNATKAAVIDAKQRGGQMAAAFR
jgi:archaellum component FlaC